MSFVGLNPFACRRVAFMHPNEKNQIGVSPLITQKDRKDLETFLSLFPESVFCYIPEGKDRLLDPDKDSRYIFHSPELDFSRNEGKGDDLTTFYGLYFSVNGFRTDLKPFKRTQSHLSSLNALYVDIDRPKPLPVDQGGLPETDLEIKQFKNDTLSKLRELDKTVPLSALVETKRGFHAYFRISPPILIPHLTEKEIKEYSPENLPEEIDRLFVQYAECLTELRLLLGGDNGAKDTSRVLRVPFSLYHKTRPTEGFSPFKIQLRLLRPNQSLSLDEYHTLLVSDKQHDIYKDLPTVNEHPEASIDAEEQKVIFKEIKREDYADKIEIPEEVRKEAFRLAIQELQKEYPKHERPSFFNGVGRLQGIPNGERNHSLLIAASILREAGKSQAEVEAFFPVYSGLSQREIASTIRSAFRPPSPYSFGWNDKILGQYVLGDEKRKVRSIVSDFATQRIRFYLSEYLAREKEAKKQKDLSPVRDELEKIIPEDDKRLLDLMRESTLSPSILTGKEQKDTISRFPDIFTKENPWFRVLDFQSPIKSDFSHGTAPELISDKDFNTLIFQAIRNLGCPQYETTTQVKNQCQRLLALPFVQSINGAGLSKEEMEAHFKRKGPFIPCKNGLLDLDSSTLLPYDEKVVFISTIQSDFKPEEELQKTEANNLDLVDRFLDSIASHNASRRMLLECLMGYTLLTDTRFQKAFILIGGGSNGKSTFTDALTSMLGVRNTIPFTLKDLSKNFFLSTIYGKRLGIVEEIESNYFESDIFKKIVSGGMVSADRKYLSPIDFTPFMKIVMSVNTLPKINDTSHGLFRRLTVIPFEASFEGKEKDIYLKEKLANAKNAFLFFALRGLRLLLKDSSFPLDIGSESFLDEYRVRNTPSLSMLEAWYKPVKKESKQYESTLIDLFGLFKEYQQYCYEYGSKPKSIWNFIDELGAIKHPAWSDLKVILKNGKRYLIGAERKSELPQPFLKI